MEANDGCVLHVADARDAEALQTLCRSTQALASAGVEQVLIILAHNGGDDVLWESALPAQVRSLRCPSASVFGTLGALRAELHKISREKAVHAVHLHGVAPCLLGARALKSSPLAARVLYSPHLCRGSRWSSALLGRLLQGRRALPDCAAVTTSLAEAQALGRALGRSAQVLPYAVSGVFFAAARRESARPSVLADGPHPEACAVVSRLSVLLNGRGARMPFFWLGAADAGTRAQLAAAGVELLVAPDDAERAHALSLAWAFIHLTRGERSLLAVAQAMAAGVPSLVSDTMAHRALICHGETGFICTGERDLLEYLVRLAREPEERQRIGEAARAEAERRFTPRHFDRAVLRAYGLSGRKAPSMSIDRNEEQACRQLGD
jgi:hypothetical protein